MRAGADAPRPGSCHKPGGSAAGRRACVGRRGAPHGQHRHQGRAGGGAGSKRRRQHFQRAGRGCAAGWRPRVTECRACVRVRLSERCVSECVRRCTVCYMGCWAGRPCAGAHKRKAVQVKRAAGARQSTQRRGGGGGGAGKRGGACGARGVGRNTSCAPHKGREGRRTERECTRSGGRTPPASVVVVVGRTRALNRWRRRPGQRPPAAPPSRAAAAAGVAAAPLPAQPAGGCHPAASRRWRRLRVRPPCRACGKS